MRGRPGNRFIRRGTPIKRGGSSVNRGGFHNSKVKLYTSSSSESYNINDDIPMVNETQVKPSGSTAALLSSESSYVSDDNYNNQDVSTDNDDLKISTKSISSSNNNQPTWKPTNTPNRRRLKSPPNTSNNRNTPRTSIQKPLEQKNESYGSYEYEEDNENSSNSQNNNTELRINTSSQSNNNKLSQNSNSKNNNNLLENNSSSQSNINVLGSNSSSQNNNNELNSKQPTHPQKNNNNDSQNNLEKTQNDDSNLSLNENIPLKKATTNDFESWVEKSDTTSIVSPQPSIMSHQVIDQSKRSLTFLREKGSLLKKESFRLLENHRVLFYSSEGKDHIGHFHVISTQPTCTIGDSGYKGFLRQNLKNTKFLFISDETKPHDDREGEIYGICLHNQTIARKFKVKALTIALIEDKKPYFSISKRLSLTSVASGQTENLPNVIKFTSKLPEVNEKGKLSLDLGNIFLVPSCKNMIIYDSNNEIIFSFVKINEGSFSVHCVPPIDPLAAFGIGIAIIKAL